MTIFLFFSDFWLVFDSFFKLFQPRGQKAPGPLSPAFFRGFLGRDLFDPCRRPTMSQEVSTVLVQRN